MRRLLILATLLVLAGCARKGTPVASPEAVPAHLREAIAIEYAGVPTLTVHAEPNDASAVVGSFGYTETVSVLERKGEWVLIRTLDGSGWARREELISAGEAERVLKDPTPRFLTRPVEIPNPRARGRVLLEAKVNTDGQIVDIRIVENTTRSLPLAEANAAALKTATFYPLIQKGQRVTFTYRYVVDY